MEIDLFLRDGKNHRNIVLAAILIGLGNQLLHSALEILLAGLGRLRDVLLHNVKDVSVTHFAMQSIGASEEDIIFANLVSENVN